MKIFYQICRVGSCPNRVIELNLEMLILTRFVMENYFVHVRIKKLMLNIFKNGENNILETSCRIRFYLCD